MKNTGIIRRIDDLGRIVIPKEIRKKIKINDGENIEIYVYNDQIILQKYSNVKSISEVAQKLVDSIYYILKDTILITDTDCVIAVSNNNRHILNKQISNRLLEIIKCKKNIILKNINIVDNVEIDGKYKINPIIENGNVKGSLILISNLIDKNKEKIIDINTIFLNKYLED